MICNTAYSDRSLQNQGRLSGHEIPCTYICFRELLQVCRDNNRPCVQDPLSVLQQLPHRDSMLLLWKSLPYFINSSAIALICPIFSAFTADFIVTVVSSHVISLDFSNLPLIYFAAVTAHVPFSIIPIVRFW